MKDEENDLTEALLNLVCEDVEVPTDEAGEAAKATQEGVHIVDDNPINGLAWAADLDKEQRARLWGRNL